MQRAERVVDVNDDGVMRSLRVCAQCMPHVGGRISTDDQIKQTRVMRVTPFCSRNDWQKEALLAAHDRGTSFVCEIDATTLQIIVLYVHKFWHQFRYMHNSKIPLSNRSTHCFIRSTFESGLCCVVRCAVITSSCSNECIISTRQ